MNRFRLVALAVAGACLVGCESSSGYDYYYPDESGVHDFQCKSGGHVSEYFSVRNEMGYVHFVNASPGNVAVFVEFSEFTPSNPLDYSQNLGPGETSREWAYHPTRVLTARVMCFNDQ